MSWCQSCGGVIGGDCWNPRECAEITAQMRAEEIEAHWQRQEEDHWREQEQSYWAEQEALYALATKGEGREG